MMYKQFSYNTINMLHKLMLHVIYLLRMCTTYSCKRVPLVATNATILQLHCMSRFLFSQFLSYSRDHELRLETYCLDVNVTSNLVPVKRCHGERGTQAWRFNRVKQRVGYTILVS